MMKAQMPDSKKERLKTECQADLVSPDMPGFVDEPQYGEVSPTVDDLLAMTEAKAKKVLAELTLSDLKALRKELKEDYLEE